MENKHHKGEWCIYDKYIYCQEDDCSTCEIHKSMMEL